MDLEDIVDDSHSDVEEASPDHLGSSSIDLHMEDDLPICNNEVRRSDIAPEQLGGGCNKEVKRSDVAPEQ